MLSFKQRSYKQELLDGTDIPFEAIKRNMQELDFINRKLGGHEITLDGIAELIKNAMHFNNTLFVVEIGCGGGDNLRAIKEWANHTQLKVQLAGIDKNKECIVFAKTRKGNEKIDFIQADYKEVVFDKKPDIVFSSLFCHHFTDDEVVPMLVWMKQNSAIGFFINDLHRHFLAFYFIKIMTTLFSKSYLVKNDAPLSVQRGFVKQDWKRLLAAAGEKKFTIQWRWAFRWLITCSK